jgi:prophage antirepressor-like protein
MNDLMIFENEKFGKVRSVVKDGEVWFVAKDVCDCLDINNSRQALTRLDEDEKNSVILKDGIPGNPEKAIINEFGLYSLILGSRKNEAKQFKRWITHEVIPSIRKTGSYSLVPQTFQEALLLAAKLEGEKQQLLLANKELEKTKAYISDKKTATAMNTLFFLLIILHQSKKS